MDKCPRHAGEIHIRQKDWDKVWRDKVALLEALERACDSVAPDRFGDGRPIWYDEARAAIAQAKGNKT